MDQTDGTMRIVVHHTDGTISTRCLITKNRNSLNTPKPYSKRERNAIFTVAALQARHTKLDDDALLAAACSGLVYENTPTPSIRLLELLNDTRSRSEALIQGNIKDKRYGKRKLKKAMKDVLQAITYDNSIPMIAYSADICEDLLHSDLNYVEDEVYKRMERKKRVFPSSGSKPQRSV